MTVEIKLTPTQQRIMDVLSDGKPHTKGELHACLDDELAESLRAVNFHLSKIREKLRPTGQDILCVWKGRNVGHFQLVRLISTSKE